MNTLKKERKKETEWNKAQTLQEIVKDGEAWRAAVHGIVKNRTQLSDWITAILNPLTELDFEKTNKTRLQKKDSQVENVPAVQWIANVPGVNVSLPTGIYRKTASFSMIRFCFCRWTFILPEVCQRSTQTFRDRRILAFQELYTAPGSDVVTPRGGGCMRRCTIHLLSIFHRVGRSSLFSESTGLPSLPIPFPLGFSLQKNLLRDFPGGPGFKIPGSQGRRPGLKLDTTSWG